MDGLEPRDEKLVMTGAALVTGIIAIDVILIAIILLS